LQLRQTRRRLRQPQLHVLAVYLRAGLHLRLLNRRIAMTSNRRVLCGVYAVIAVVALVGTWSQNIAYLHHPAGFGGFLPDLSVNAAARSITIDILLFFLAAAIFMVREARRLAIPYVWAYLLGGMLIAISVTFPLFLIARERRLAAIGTAGPAIE
jgi:hypothetical protein